MTAQKKPGPHHSSKTPGKGAPESPGDPAAGPHAKPHLTDPQKTPGAGSLPDPKRPAEGDATTG